MIYYWFRVRVRENSLDRGERERETQTKYLKNE